MRYMFTASILAALFFVNCGKSNPGLPAESAYLSVNNVTLARDSTNSIAKFIITVEPSLSKIVSVNYTTVEGTAKANIDFVPASGTLQITPNTREVYVNIEILGRKLNQSKQEFYLQLSQPANATIRSGRATAELRNAGLGYQLVWSDEFNSSSLNTNDWNYETGGGGWGNNELQNYTLGTNNAYLESGNLVIEAKDEKSGNNQYSSARLTTKGKRKFTFGKVDIRAKVPASKGLWPALWMLGENIDQVNWPACGEIDIMEMINKESPSKVYGTAHWGINPSAHLSNGGNYSLPLGFFTEDYHIFSLEWDADKIQWLVDGTRYHQVTRQQVSGGNYPFDKDFFFIINVAVGGNWPGSPDATSVFPQKMYVDYIRVYQK